MKAKRFLSLLLSLALTVSLAAPALALEEPDAGALSREEFIAEYIAKSPVAEDFDDEAWYWEYEAWDLDYMTKEEYMEWMELTEEEFRAEMWKSYAWEMGLPIYTEAERAYETYMVERYEAAHPGELESLTTETLLAQLGYTDTLTPVEQFMKGWELDSETEVRPALLRDYVMDRLAVEETHAAFLGYQEEHPQEWEEFDADAYYEQEWDYTYMDKAEFMSSWHLFTQEEFAEAMFVEYVEYYLADGGYGEEPPDGWYWDGQDYERLITLCVNGQVMDADVTAEGGVTYADAETVNAILGTHYSAGEGPVPLRSAAQAAGWDVTWNSYRRQVVLLDREKLLAGVIVPGQGWVEEDLSGLDRLAEKARAGLFNEPGQSYQKTGTLTLTYTALNSLDGDEEYTAQVKVETLRRDQNWEGTLTIDLADVLRLMPESALKELRAQLPKTVKDLKTLLDGVKVSLIWNGETGTLYLNAPVLALVDPTPGTDGDTWYSFDLAELLPEEESAERVSQLLYEALLEDSGTSWGGAENAYVDFVDQKALLHILFGPHAITEKNGTMTWKLDGETISAAVTTFMGSIGEPGGWEEHSLFKECDLELTVGARGETSFDMVLRPDMEGITAALFDRDRYSYDYSILESLLLSRTMSGLADFRLTVRERNSAQGGQSHMELHWKNRFKLELEVDAVRREVQKAPRTTPPEGAEIVEAY